MFEKTSQAAEISIFLFQSIHFKKQCVNHMENSALIILTAVEPWNKWS